MALLERNPLPRPGHLEPGIWAVQLPFQTPMSLNDRQGYWAKAKSTKSWREGTLAALLPLEIPPCARVSARLFYTPSANRRRDPDNLVLSYKPVIDALVDAGIVPDDTQEEVERHWPWITAKQKDKPEGRFLLVVERLA
jgi:crossover junction endodeoxyribonuclease RusA